MQIRIEGRSSEMDGAVGKLKTVFEVTSVSMFYPNRGMNCNCDYGRTYVTLAGDSYERYKNGASY